MGLGLAPGGSACEAHASRHPRSLPAVRTTPGPEGHPLAPLNLALRFPFCEVGTGGLGSLAGGAKLRTPECRGAVGTQGAPSA